MLGVEDRRSSAQKAGGLLSGLRRRSSGRRAPAAKQDPSPSSTTGAESEPESVHLGSTKILKYEKSLSKVVSGGGEENSGKGVPRRRSNSRSSSSSKSNRQGLILSDTESLAMFSQESSSVTYNNGQVSSSITASTTAATSLHVSRRRGNSAVSDDEFVRSRQQAPQPWASTYDALFGIDKAEEITSSNRGQASAQFPKGYRHHRKAPPPPPPMHKPRSKSGDVTGATESLPADPRSRSQSAVVASSESSGPRGGDLLSNSAGGGGVNGDVDPEARQQEVMAVLSAFRSMGSKEVRATALQLGNVLHGPKKPDLTAKPLKSALKKSRASESGEADTGDVIEPAITLASSPPPSEESPVIAKPTIVKQGSVWKQINSQWLACGVIVQSAPEPSIQLSIQGNQHNQPAHVVSYKPKDILSVQQTQGTAEFNGGYFTMQTEAELHTFAVPGKDDCDAMEWITTLNCLLSESMMSSLSSHPVKSPSTISIQESGYGSASQDTLEKYCSVSSDTSTKGISIGSGGSAAATPEEPLSRDVTGLRAQLASKLGGRDTSTAVNEDANPKTTSPLTAPDFSPTTRQRHSDADRAASRASNPPVIQVEHLETHLQVMTSFHDDDDLTDDDEHGHHHQADGRLSASGPGASSLTRSQSHRASMRNAMHSVVTIPAPVVEPSFRTMGTPSSQDDGEDMTDGYERKSRRSSMCLALSEEVNTTMSLSSKSPMAPAMMVTPAGGMNPDPLDQGDDYDQQAEGSHSSKSGGGGLSAKKNSKRGWLTVRLTKKEKEEQQKKIIKKRFQSSDHLDDDDDDPSRQNTGNGGAPSAFLPPMAIVPRPEGATKVGETITFSISNGMPTPPARSQAAGLAQRTSSPPQPPPAPPSLAERPHTSHAMYSTSPDSTDGAPSTSTATAVLLARTSNNSPSGRGTPPVLLPKPASVDLPKESSSIKSVASIRGHTSLDSSVSKPIPPPPPPPLGTIKSESPVPRRKALLPPQSSVSSATSARASGPPPPPPRPHVKAAGSAGGGVQAAAMNGGEEVSGLLWRQQPGSVLWQKLHVRLSEEDNSLRLFSTEKKDAGKPPLEVIKLASVAMVNRILDLDGVAQEERFELVAHDKTEHLFSTNSAADCQHWIGVLSEAVYRSQKKERKEQRRLKRQASMVDESKRPSSRAGGQTTGSISPGTHTPASQGSRTPGTNTPPVSLPVSPKHLAAAATTSSKALPRKLSMINAAQNSVIAKIEPPLPPVRPMKPKPPALSRPANDLALPEKSPEFSPSLGIQPSFETCV